jgi:hypothetical protein
MFIVVAETVEGCPPAAGSRVAIEILAKVKVAASPRGAHQGTGGLPLFQRTVARTMANISPRIIPILIGPPWRASSFK